MKRFLFCFIIFFSALLIGCSVNPVTGKRELILVSKGQEKAIGKKSDKEITAQYGIYKDKYLYEYVNSVGRKIVKHVHRHDVNYTFRVLDSVQVNAFAVPGGYVYITRGLLAYLNNEAQLAGVLGHELGHINARHTAKQMTYSMLAQIGMNIGMIAVPELKQFSGLISKGVQLLFLKFSRDDEYEADYLGVLYSVKSGYNANEMGKFFQTLNRIGKKEHSALPEFLSTHPNPVNRIAEVRKNFYKIRNKSGIRKFKVDKKNYLKHVEGLIFGEDPRQGFFEKGFFYHPVLKFKFRAPEKWKLYNNPSQVILLSDRKDAVIVFHISKGRSLNDAVNKYMNNNNLKMYYIKNIFVNGFRAVKTGSVVKSKNYAVISYFIDMNGKVYEFDCIYKDFNEKYLFVPNSFSYLTDRGKINKKPKRIHVVKVKSKISLKKILSYYGITDKKSVDEIAVLNGIYPNDILKKGNLIKIVK